MISPGGHIDMQVTIREPVRNSWAYPLQLCIRQYCARPRRSVSDGGDDSAGIRGRPEIYGCGDSRGVVLVVWIATAMAVINELSWLQASFGAVGKLE